VLVPSSGMPRETCILPSEALEIPTFEEIAKRWPGMTPNQVQDLVNDYNTERSVLSSSGPSDADFSTVRNLLQKDIGRDV